MEVKIIRGYKLKLWKDRLRLAPEFVSQLDLYGLNFIHGEYPSVEGVTIILFTKIRGQRRPIPVMLKLTTEELNSISERITLHGKNNSHN